MTDLVIAILLTYQTKCGVHLQTDIQVGFKTEKECIRYGEHIRKLYTGSTQTNVIKYEYTCYRRD